MTINRYVRSWAEAIDVLLMQPPKTTLRFPKFWLPDPQTAGMTPSIGLPEGQLADFRMRLGESAGFHVKDFGQHFEAHIDEVHPDVNPIEHLRRDAPGTFLAGGVAVGALLGTALGRKGEAALGGALLGGLLAALLLPSDDSKTR